MPSIYDLWPKKWLEPEDLQGKKPAVTIEAVNVESLYNPRSKQQEPKIVLTFYKKERRLPLNKTQAEALATITRTDDYTLWAGCQVVISAGRAPNGKSTIVISPIPDKEGSAPCAA